MDPPRKEEVDHRNNTPGSSTTTTTPPLHAHGDKMMGEKAEVSPTVQVSLEERNREYRQAKEGWGSLNNISSGSSGGVKSINSSPTSAIITS